MLRPWTQLSASPHTVRFQWKAFLDHVDHAALRATRRWTMARPKMGTIWSHGIRGTGVPSGREYEGLVRLPGEAAFAEE